MKTRRPQNRVKLVKGRKVKPETQMCGGRIIMKGEDGLWRDQTGCVYALPDAASSLDKEVRAGIGPFSMPEGSPVNDVAKAHDTAYSTPAYQAFHTRKEADLKLYNDIAAMPTWHKHLALPFYAIVRSLGWLFWENPKTR